MENNNFSYESKSYAIIKATLIAFLGLILMISGVIILGRYLHSKSFVIFGFITVCIIPFFFRNKYISIFLKKIKLNFDSKSFSLSEFDRNNNLIKTTNFNFESIESYKFNFSSSKITELKISLKDGSSKHFMFYDCKDQEQSISELSVFSTFHYFISKYNNNKEADRISVKPGFLSTKKGSILILILFFVAITSIVLSFILHIKTPHLSFMSLFIILGLIAKRKSDNNFYELVNQLKPRNPFNNN